MRTKIKTPRTLAPESETSFARRIIAHALVLLLFTQAVAPPALARTMAAGASRAGAPAAATARAVRGGPQSGGTSPQVVHVSNGYGIVLSPLSTAFDSVVGIDFHQPTAKVIVSANSPAGLPDNFELIDADGTHRAFSNVGGLPGELKFATARDDGQGLSTGGFKPGEVLTATGVPGAVARIAPDGSSVRNPWVTLPGEAGLPNGLYLDRAGVFAGNLVAVTTAGGVWRVNSAGAATKVADLGTRLSGVVTVPDDADKYGPWAGKILAGAKDQTLVYAVDAQGGVTSYDLGVYPADVRLVTAHENFYAVDPADGKIWGAQAAAFTEMAGDLLVAQESPGALSRVHWNGTDFEVSQIASAGQLKQTAFAPAGLAEIPAVKQVYEKIAVVRHAPAIDSGRIEGALWQLTGEAVTLDGTDTITSDLLVPGTPSVSVSGTPTYGGTVAGTESAQPAGYPVTITGNATLRHLVTRTDPIQLSAVAAPPAPAGTRDVSLSQAGQSVGDFSTLRHLTLSGKAGAVSVPPGTYGRFAASSHTAFVLGVENSQQPSVYNLESLSLSGSSELRVVGPVVLTVANGVTLTGSTAGSGNDPRQLVLQVSGGVVGVGGGSVLYALVRAPQSTITVDGKGRLRGTVSCDRLTVAGGGVLQVTEGDLPPPPVNRFPTVNAGPDQTITLPTDTVSLSGSASDDGLPAGSTLSAAWSEVSGPGAVTFADASSPATTATFTQPGTYVLRLGANDTLLTSSDDVTVTVIPRNQPPSVNAGPDQTIELPDAATLIGTVSDDALPRGSVTTVAWSKVSGPGSIAFAHADSATTAAAFDAPGTYTLRLTASDTELTSSDDVVVTVLPENQPPVANAGADITIRLPASAQLGGSVSDDGLPAGSTLTANWTQANGPGAVSFADPNSPTTTATFGAPGTYVLRLTASDTRLTASDDVTVTVLPANLPPAANAGPDKSALLGVNLLQNAGCESALVENKIPFWASPDGGAWAQGAGGVGGPPFSVEGDAYFYPSGAGATELQQDVDVSSFAASVAGGAQQFEFKGYARAGAGSPPDGSRVVVEYRDASNATVLASFDSGEVTSAGWSQVADTRAAPAGTRWIRVRLISSEHNSQAGGGLFDGLSLRAVSAAAVSLDGAVTDDGLPAGAPLTAAWSKVSGPGGVGFADPSSATTSATFDQAGTYVLRLTASDSEFSNADDVTVTVAAANLPPAVSAGADAGATVGLPLTLAGTATDDGLPAGSALSANWIKASGPGTVSFADARALSTTATFDQPGAYVLRLTVSDSEFAVSGEVVVTVTPANQAPVVNAGPDQTVTLPAPANLSGSVSDDGLPAGGALTATWSEVSGPGEVAFADAHAAVTTAAFSAPGTYVLRLSASDSDLTSADDVTVTVAASNRPPTVNAGADQVITLPVSTATLAGSVADDGLPAGGNLSVTWSQVSGPAAASFADPRRPATSVTICQPGVYVFRLTADDGQLTSSDDVTVAVRVKTTQTLISGDGPVGGRDAAHQFTTDGGQTYQSAFIVAPYRATFGTANWNLISGTNYINWDGTFSSPSDTTVRFRRKFVLPDDFAAPSLAGQILVDDSVTVYLNGTPINVYSGWDTPASFAAADPSLFHAGENTLDFDLYNYCCPAGFDYKATLSYTSAGQRPNLAPVVSAGFAQTITLPVNSVTLGGTVTDDDLPGCAQLTATWTKVSGPGAVTFADPGAASTTATFGAAGTYVLRLTASDTELSASGDVTVTVNPPINKPPDVSAGPNQTVTMPDSATLNGTATDDGLPEGGSLTTTWTKVSGPGSDGVTRFFGDDFNDNTIDPNKWESFEPDAIGAQLFERNQRMEFHPGSQSGGGTFRSHDYLDARGLAVYFKFGGYSTASHQDTRFLIHDYVNQTSVWVDIINGTIQFYADSFFDAVSRGDGVMPYDGTSPIWVRWRQSGSQYFWDTSTDGVNWTQRIAANVYRPASAAYAFRFTYFSDPGGPNIYFDDFTMAPPAESNDPGAGQVTFGDPHQQATTAAFSAPGTYILRLTANDSLLTSNSLVTVTVKPQNHPPTVDAGPDQTVSLPHAATLAGSVTDDGLPEGGTLTRSWTKVSGPGAVTFADPGAASTTATFGAAGTYVLRLTASDSQLSASDDVTVTVTPPNSAPQVNAGPDLSVTLPARAALSGTVTDDGLPAGGALTSQWSVVSGPGAVTFADAASPATTAAFGAEGTYVLRLTASDSELSASDDVTVTVVSPPNQPPVVSAGADQTVTPGLNLVRNPGGEEPVVAGVIPGWTKAEGDTWAQAPAGTPGFYDSFEGDTYFYAAGDAHAELRQDVDVSAYAASIATGAQQFAFVAHVRAGAENPADSARVVFEFRDAADANVLATVDSGEITTSEAWQSVEGAFPAPAGTGFVRVRLIATRNSGATTDAFFDSISLRAVGVAGAKLGGTATDDGLPVGSSTAATWSVVSGPGTVAFADAHAASTSATFDRPGTYVLRLSASDTQLTSSGDVTVTVTAANAAPTADAGADQTVTLPTDTASLVGTINDDGLPQGRSVSARWRKVAGPGGVTFADAGAAQTSATFSAAGNYVLRLTADDSDLSTSDEVVVTVKPAPVNQPPTVNAGPDQSLSLPNQASLAGQAADDGLPSGSTLTYAWSEVSGPGAVTFSNPSSLATAAAFAAEGVYTLRLTASDSQLSSSDDVTVTVHAAGTNNAPVVSAGPDTEVRLPDAASLSGNATDDGLPTGGALSVAWSVVSGPGAVTFASPTSARTQASFASSGTYVLRLTASDSELSSSDDVTVSVFDPVTGPAPSVAFNSLADGEEVTAPKAITGTVSGGAWRLEYALLEDETAPVQQWHAFASGSGAVSDAPLGTFDPTVLLNGTYAVRLVSTDSAGQTSVASVSVVVARQMKVGNFTVSFNDLSVPVAGIPIQVTRTYDSRDKRVGDFGVGWTLSVASARVQKTVPVGSNWYETESFASIRTYCLQSTRPQLVTVTFGDGKVYKFQAVPAQQCQRFEPFSTVQIQFVPVEGTRGSLTPLNGGAVSVAGSVPGPVDLVDINDPSGYYLNPTRFRLTTEDGTSFVLDQKSGVESISVPSGETLSFTRDGVTHSSGEAVTFVRDGQGRIGEVRDPAGHSRYYTYDGNGDLGTFRDADGNTTTFTYAGDHMLAGMEVRSADGTSVFHPVDNSYVDGRLVKQLDADGHEINYNHDLADRSEVVTDRLGNQTTYEYDERGNVVYVKDAEGGETRRSYDDRDNMLTETTSEGTTTNVYDDSDNLTQTTDPYGNVTKYTYNALKKVTSMTDPLGRVTTNAYDEQKGLLLKAVDAVGNETDYAYEPLGSNLTSTTVVAKEDPTHPRVTSYGYDRLGRLSSETDPSGATTSYAYDANNNRASQTVTRTRADGTQEQLTTSFEYDADSRLTKTTYPDGTFTTVAYNELGKQTSTKDQLGRETKYEYDSQGRLFRTTRPGGGKDESAYDAEGRRTSSTDPAGRVTSFTFDRVGRLTETTYADGGRTTATYDALGRVLTQSRWLDSTTKYTTVYRYDSEGKNRVVYVTDALNNTTKQTFDEAGNLSKVTDAKGHTTAYEYDGNNRRTKTTYADSTFDVTAYDGFGQVAAKTDQAAKTTRFQYDAAGRLVKVTDAAGKETSYGYDELGHQTSQTDANLHTTRYEYDQLGRRTKRTLPEGMSELYSYNEAGLLKTRTDFNGKTTAYEYDSLNRLTKKTPDASFNQPAVSFTYTATGRRETMTDATGVTTYTYDSRDRLLTKQAPQGTLAYTYDKLGELKTVRSSNSNGVSVDYGYDGLSRLASVTDNRQTASNVTSYTYDGVGNLESYTYGNGVKSLYAYNALNRLTNLTVSKATTTINGYAYTLGAAGNRESVTEANGRSVSYSYDALYRLTGETVSGDAGGINGSVGYTYDDVGNRLTRAPTLPGVAPQAFAYDKNDRLTSDTYDANGNTRQSQGGAYAYDWENHLTSVNDGSIAYTYDGDGNRVAKTVGGVTTSYLVDTNNPTGYAQVVEELQGGAVTRQYTYGSDLISERQLISGNWVMSFYGYDGHGSVRFLTDPSGAVTDTYTYDAFGTLTSVTGGTPNEYLYAGERYDAETGMYYLRARYMQPATGRFWTQDTYEGSPFDPQSLHKYIYTNNSPVNGADPSGHFFDDLVVDVGVRQTVAGISIPLFQRILVLAAAALLATGSVLLPTGELEAAKNEARIKLKASIEQDGKASGKRILYHYTSFANAEKISSEGVIMSSWPFTSPPYTFPAGAYATDIPPWSTQYTQSQLSALFYGGNEGRSVDAFVAFVGDDFFELQYKPYPNQFVRVTSAGDMPVSIDVITFGTNLMRR
jgi:RHS repeat-associated protein